MEQLLVNIARGLVEDKDAVKVTADEKNAEGVTEQLKEENQLEWVCRMQNIEARAKEIVYKCNVRI